MRHARLTVTTSSLALALGVLLASPAQAQTAGTAPPPDAETAPVETDDPPAVGAPEADAIVVTGSRIARPNFEWAAHEELMQVTLDGLLNGLVIGFRVDQQFFEFSRTFGFKVH